MQPQVTVGNAWTSKRIDKGDLPCARRGRDSCLSYDMRTMAQAHTADTLCARTDTTSAVFISERDASKRQDLSNAAAGVN